MISACSVSSLPACWTRSLPPIGFTELTFHMRAAKFLSKSLPAQWYVSKSGSMLEAQNGNHHSQKFRHVYETLC